MQKLKGPGGKQNGAPTSKGVNKKTKGEKKKGKKEKKPRAPVVKKTAQDLDAELTNYTAARAADDAPTADAAME